MSKRFGRNQKRKLQKKLEQTRAAYKLQCELTDSIRRRAERDRATVERVADVLGKHFIALEPQTIQVNKCLEYLRFANTTQLYARDFRITANVAVELSIDTLKAYWVELGADRLMQQRFVILQTPNGDLGYAVSDALAESQDADRLAYEITRELQPMLARQLTRFGSTGR